MTAMDQLDLFDFIEGETRGAGGQDQLRFAAVLTCIRDAMSDALRFAVDLWAPPDRTWSMSGEWAWKWTGKAITVRVRKQGAEELSITWDEFADLVRDHPERQAVLDWEQTLEMPKWRPLTRPVELTPYAGDAHPSAIELDHAEPGWTERFKAWVRVQKILTDAINTAAPDWEDFKLPKQEWHRPRGSCRFCRQELIIGSYDESINHSPMGTMCTRMQLTRIHAWHAYRRMEANKRDPDAKCMSHQDSRKPCPQEHFEADYERDAARATEAWNGDGWKEPEKS